MSSAFINRQMAYSAKLIRYAALNQFSTEASAEGGCFLKRLRPSFRPIKAQPGFAVSRHDLPRGRYRATGPRQRSIFQGVRGEFMYGQPQDLCGLCGDYNSRAIYLVIACLRLSADFVADYV